MGKRREKIYEEASDLLLDVIDSIWQVGVVATTIMFGATILMLNWVNRLNAASEYPSIVTEALVGKYGHLLYLLPFLVLLLTSALAYKTYVSYFKHRHMW